MPLMASEPDAVEDVLRAAGVPEEALELAHGRDDPLGAFFEAMPLRGAADRTVTPAEIEATGGMPVSQSQELMRAFGLPPPAPEASAARRC